ncbi:MAG: hypothetical protein EOO66_22510, partial [Methylobacterium sp.]
MADGLVCTAIGDLARHPAGCGCGRSPGSLSEAVAASVFRAAIPQAARRRSLLRAVGVAAVAAAIGEAFPLGAATAMAEEAGRIEKPKLRIGFVPITCASPIIMAEPMGFYAKHGL